MYTADELEIRCALAGSPRAEQLIACLECEIAKRDETIARLEPQLNRAIQANYDLREELAACRVAVENCELFRARIAELESQFDGESIVCGSYRDERDAALAELAALKAQEPVEYQLRALIRDVTNIPEAGYYMPQSWHDQVIALSLSGKLDAPVSEAKAQGVVMPDVNAAAKALCNRHAIICGVDADDQWKEYSQDFIADAETVLANARLNAAPVSAGDPEKCSYQDDPRSPAELSLAGCNCVRFGECNPHWPCKLHTPGSACGVDDRAEFEAECGRLGLTLHAGSDCRYTKEIQCAWMLWQAQTKLVNKKALDLIDRVYKNHGQWLEKDPFLRELRTLLAKGVSNEG